MVKNPSAMYRSEFNPCVRKTPGEGNGYLLQYPYLENPKDRGAWWASVHRVAKSRTRLSDFAFTFFLEIKTPRINIRFIFSLMIVKWVFYNSVMSFYIHYLEPYKRLLSLIGDLINLGYLSCKNSRMYT